MQNLFTMTLAFAMWCALGALLYGVSHAATEMFNRWFWRHPRLCLFFEKLVVYVLIVALLVFLAKRDLLGD